MIGSLPDVEGTSSVGSINFAQQVQSVNGPDTLQSLTSGDTQSSATISGPGQLLSNLQQLQSQDPTKFKQVVFQITSQLQTAAQQVQGPGSDFLANLSAKFQNVADGGSPSQLQPSSSSTSTTPITPAAPTTPSTNNASNSSVSQPHHHHHHQAQQAYNQASQSQSQGVAALAQPTGSRSSTDSTLQQLFASISTEVSQALAG